MKQREFVVVVFRIFCIWFIIRSIASLPDVFRLFSQASLYNRPPEISSIVLVGFGITIPLVLALLLWKGSPWLMRRIYADYDIWEPLSDDVLESIPDSSPTLMEGTVQVSEGNTAVSSTESEEFDNLDSEPVWESAFDSRITVEDIFRVFLMILGIWMLAQNLPSFLSWVMNFISRPSSSMLFSGGPVESEFGLASFITHVTPLIIGGVLLSPSKIVTYLMSRSQSLKAQSSEEKEIENR